jgi:hypothetical protein
VQVKNVELDGRRIKLQLWDTAGQVGTPSTLWEYSEYPVGVPRVPCGSTPSTLWEYSEYPSCGSPAVPTNSRSQSHYSTTGTARSTRSGQCRSGSASPKPENKTASAALNRSRDARCWAMGCCGATAVTAKCVSTPTRTAHAAWRWHATWRCYVALPRGTACGHVAQERDLDVVHYPVGVLPGVTPSARRG